MLNLATNEISSLEELLYLKDFNALIDLRVEGNPFSVSERDLQTFILMNLPSIQVLNGKPIRSYKDISDLNFHSLASTCRKD